MTIGKTGPEHEPSTSVTDAGSECMDKVPEDLRAAGEVTGAAVLELVNRHFPGTVDVSGDPEASTVSSRDITQ